MLFWRAVRQTVVLAYLCVTALAFLYTMVRVRPPAMLWPVVRFSYGRMAPYQGDTETNEDLVLEGQLPDGRWEVIALEPYFPFGFGEANVRVYLRSFKARGHDVLRAKYAELGLQILAREHEQGRTYTTLRLLWQEWPRSPAGFDFLRRVPFVETSVIAQVP